MLRRPAQGHPDEVTYQPSHPRRGSVRRLWARLSPLQRVAVLVAGPLVLCCGGVTGVGAIGAALDPIPSATPATDRDEAADIAPLTQPRDSTTPAPPTTSTVPSSTVPAPPTTTAPATPAVRKRTVQEKRAIPFKTRTTTDPDMAEGTKEVRKQGVAGVRTLTYELTLTDGAQTAKRLISSKVTKQPTTRVIAVGTRSDEPDCDPNYSGACVPIDSDVDCAGGSGNGPSYVDGVVKVIGTDVYDLDRDNDGFGCD